MKNVIWTILNEEHVMKNILWRIIYGENFKDNKLYSSGCSWWPEEYLETYHIWRTFIVLKTRVRLFYHTFKRCFFQ